jgi:hypothetical protein
MSVRLELVAVKSLTGPAKTPPGSGRSGTGTLTLTAGSTPPNTSMTTIVEDPTADPCEGCP